MQAHTEPAKTRSYAAQVVVRLRGYAERGETAVVAVPVVAEKAEIRARATEEANGLSYVARYTAILAKVLPATICICQQSSLKEDNNINLHQNQIRI